MSNSAPHSGPTKKRVYVVYYSMYGHIQALARQIVIGLEKAGVKAKLFQVPETLPQEVKILSFKIKHSVKFI